MIFVARTSDGGEVSYRDNKRYLWILSVLSPAIPMLVSLQVWQTANPLWALAILVSYFGAIPLLDAVFGEDPYNPPEAVIEAMAADPWYRMLLFVSVPVFYASFLTTAFVVGSIDLPVWAVAALALGAGTASGAGLTVGHELGHKPNRLDAMAAKFVNALTGYGHFCIEHNRGHHVDVATPLDPASSRMGESVWQFAIREIPGAARRGWLLERARLERKGLFFWHWRNELLQGYAITMSMAFALTWAFGWIMLPFLLLHHGAGWLQLTFANYVEHYGLLRQKLSNGKYEACQPRHSWNTNHIMSNLMLFHLQRHSDHHSNPLRPYQTLRNFSDLPSLPSGYPGCYVLAAFPPLWFRVMDPRVMAWAGGDISLTNHVPGWTPRGMAVSG
ncbi:MAG: alkane 1-monooxygenase [Nitratireductor sp.]